MNKQSPYRQGAIFWLDDCPPLRGDVAKRRPVIIVSTEAMISKAGGQLVVVACTSTVYPDDVEAIELPNRAQMPNALTGLNKRTWAIPYWFLVVEPGRLTDRAGYVPSKLMNRIFLRYDFYFQLQLRQMEEDTQ